MQRSASIRFDSEVTTKDYMETIFLQEEQPQSLGYWRQFIERLIAEHGEQSNLVLDAGYNNISMSIEKTVV